MTEPTRPNLRIRPGLRIITSCRQRRLGGQKYPGRRGRVHSCTDYPVDTEGKTYYWRVNLESTARAKPRAMEWYAEDEVIPKTLTHWPDGLEG